MFRRFLSDERGNYMIVTAMVIVPLMAAVALAVDYSEMSRQRQDTLNALDAANFATARRFLEGTSTNQQIADYAKEYFEANLGSVDPRNATLSVQFPAASTGGGTIKLSAQLKYQPYFAPTSNVAFSASSSVQLKNTLEVALVLDNSGSMDYTGSGSGKKRMVLLKEAATQLVDTLAGQGAAIKQVDKSVQFALVPFAASVNVGPSNAGASWMDTDGRSPIHHENFDWSTMSQSLASSNGNRWVQQISGVWYKKGSGWGTEENQKVTRFSMYNDMKRIISQTQDKTEWKCEWVGWWKCGFVTTPGTTTFGAYAPWAGCVEARPHPYNTNDAAPSSSTPATLYVPMFGPDETDNRDSSYRYASNNYWNDATSNSNNLARQKYMPKYFREAPQGTSAASGDEGPNASCTTKPITPLTDVTKQAGLDKIKAAINAMVPNGATNVPEGTAWGWRVVSGGAPFTEGRPDSEKGNDKVVIVLTDGENTYYTPNSLGANDLAGNKSTYSAYGYTGVTQPGGSHTRLFMNTSSSVNKSDFSNGNYSRAMDEQMAATCGSAKSAGVIVMTVALDLSATDTQQKAQIDGLKACASESRFRKAADGTPAKLFWNSTGGDLSKTFKEIADELSNLRLVG